MGKSRSEVGDAAAATGVIGQQQVHLAGQRTRFVDQLAPQLAAFPPAVVAGAVAETEEDRQHQAEQGERRDGNALDAGRRRQLHHRGHRDGQDQDGQHLRRDRFYDRAAQDVQQLPAVGTGSDDHGQPRRARIHRHAGLAQPFIVRPCPARGRVPATPCRTRRCGSDHAAPRPRRRMPTTTTMPFSTSPAQARPRLVGG